MMCLLSCRQDDLFSFPYLSPGRRLLRCTIGDSTIHDTISRDVPSYCTLPCSTRRP